MKNSRDFNAINSKAYDNKRVLVKVLKTGEIHLPIIETKEFEKIRKKDNVEIAGYVERKNGKCTNKEYGSLYYEFNEKKYRFDVYSRKPALTGTYGYVQTGENEYLEVVDDSLKILLIGALSVVLVFAVVFAVNLYSDNYSHLIPDSDVPEEKEVIEDNTENITDYVVYVTLPEGNIEIKYFGEETGEEAPSGEVEVKATIKIDNVDHLLLDDKIQMNNNVFDETMLDFTKLDYELEDGIYESTITIVLPDETVEEFTNSIVIRHSSGGTVGIGYSDKAYINLEEGTISLKYSPSQGTHQTKLHVYVVNNGKEYLIGQTDILDNNVEVSALALEEGMASRLSTGVYNGIMRVYLINDDGTQNEVSSDIEIYVIVE